MKIFLHTHLGEAFILMPTAVELDARVRRALDIVAARIAQPIVVPAIAGEVGVSPSTGWGQNNLALYVQLFWQRFVGDSEIQTALQGTNVVPEGFSYPADADAAGYVAILPYIYQTPTPTFHPTNPTHPPSALSFHFYESSYHILWQIQSAITTLPAPYASLPEIKGEALHNDPLAADSYNQALSEWGSNAIWLQYLTSWFYNALPAPGQTVPAQPRPAPVDVGNYKAKGW